MRPVLEQNCWDEFCDNIPPDAMRFSYHWRHLTSKNSGVKTLYCLTSELFYRYLNELNRTGGYEWKYWSDD